MTGQERQDLALVLEVIRDWREDDREWKADVAGRLRTVEGYISGQQARDMSVDKAGINRRAKIALAVSTIGVAVSASALVISTIFNVLK